MPYSAEKNFVKVDNRETEVYPVLSMQLQKDQKGPCKRKNFVSLEGDRWQWEEGQVERFEGAVSFFIG